MIKLYQILFIVSLYINAIYSDVIPIDEYNALYDLYNSTNGDNWIWQNETMSGLKWNFSINTSSVCSWQGISCSCDNKTEYHEYITDEVVYGPYGYGGNHYFYYDDALNYVPLSSCHINKLYLINYNLTGSISSSIGYLRNITHLHLVGNSLVGSIPNTFCDIISLRKVSFSQNQMTGQIPQDIDKLINLEYFVMHVNKLNGPLPKNIVYLSKLKTLGLGHNHITSSLPSNIQLMTSLEEIYLEKNQMTGSIPSSIALLPSLRYFVMTNNSITGSVPSLGKRDYR